MARVARGRAAGGTWHHGHPDPRKPGMIRCFRERPIDARHLFPHRLVLSFSAGPASRVLPAVAGALVPLALCRRLPSRRSQVRGLFAPLSRLRNSRPSVLPGAGSRRSPNAQDEFGKDSVDSEYGPRYAFTGQRFAGRIGGNHRSPASIDGIGPHRETPFDHAGVPPMATISSRSPPSRESKIITASLNKAAQAKYRWGRLPMRK